MVILLKLWKILVQTRTTSNKSTTHRKSQIILTDPELNKTRPRSRRKVHPTNTPPYPTNSTTSPSRTGRTTSSTSKTPSTGTYLSLGSSAFSSPTMTTHNAAMSDLSTWKLHLEPGLKLRAFLPCSLLSIMWGC